MRSDLILAWTFLFLSVSSVSSLKKAWLPIHIFTFQKDESKSVLLAWFNYHVRLLGNSKHIHIIDHNSKSRETCTVLLHLRSRGADIIPFVGSFDEKAATLSGLMAKYTDFPAYLVPLDVDEFIVSINPDMTFGVDAQTIVNRFQLLPQDGYKYKFWNIDGYLCNRSEALKQAGNSSILAIRNFGHAKINCYSKTFYLSRGFVATDQGNHRGHVTEDATCTDTSPLHQEECAECFHNSTTLGIIHYGGQWSFTFEEYSRKMIKRASDYNYSHVKSREECMLHNRGRHYCLYMVKKERWTLAAREKQFRHRTSCLKTTFISDVMVNYMKIMSPIL